MHRRHFLGLLSVTPFLGRMIGDVKPIVPVRRYIPDYKRIMLILENTAREGISTIEVSVDDFKVQKASKLFLNGYRDVTQVVNKVMISFPQWNKEPTTIGSILFKFGKLEFHQFGEYRAHFSPCFLARMVQVTMVPGNIELFFPFEENEF